MTNDDMMTKGGSQKVTSDDEGEGGVRIPPKNDDVIYEQPLTLLLSWHCCIMAYYRLPEHSGKLVSKTLQ